MDGGEIEKGQGVLGGATQLKGTSIKSTPTVANRHS